MHEHQKTEVFLACALKYHLDLWLTQALWYKRIESQEVTCSMTSEANMQFGKID